MLNSTPAGHPVPADQLLPLVYDELRRLAAHKMEQEPPGNTLQPTALVHEAWVRLTSSPEVKWDGRAHFFAAAAEAMRRILIEKVRRKRARRHGGMLERLDIDSIEVEAPAKEDEMLAVDEVLEKFARLHPQKAEIVKLRYFVGVTLEEAAKILAISVPTAKRHWTFARAWLYREIGQQRHR